MLVQISVIAPLTSSKNAKANAGMSKALGSGRMAGHIEKTENVTGKRTENNRLVEQKWRTGQQRARGQASSHSLYTHVYAHVCTNTNVCINTSTLPCVHTCLHMSDLHRARLGPQHDIGPVGVEVRLVPVDGILRLGIA